MRIAATPDGFTDALQSSRREALNVRVCGFRGWWVDGGLKKRAAVVCDGFAPCVTHPHRFSNSPMFHTLRNQLLYGTRKMHPCYVGRRFPQLTTNLHDHQRHRKGEGEDGGG